MDYKIMYEQAIKRAKAMIQVAANQEEIYNSVITIFPKLADSEDERIRKSLIDMLKNDEKCYLKEIDWLEKQGEPKPVCKMQVSDELYEHIRNTCACIDDALSSKSFADINDYLSMAERSAQSAFDMIEKQSGQKPADKVKPKFKVGDTIAKKHNSDIHDFGSFTITDITGEKYWYNDRIICDITEQDEWEIYEPVRQNSFVWSKEDEEMLNDIIMCGERHCYLDVGNITWLKLLKEKYIWKPSDEQITWLYRAADDASKDSRMKQVLNNLLSDLKKLREE